MVAPAPLPTWRAFCVRFFSGLCLFLYAAHGAQADVVHNAVVHERWVAGEACLLVRGSDGVYRAILPAAYPQVAGSGWMP